MSTTTLSTNNLYRIGGITAILGILLSVGYLVIPVFLAFGALVLIAYLFALYRFFQAGTSGLGLVATVLGIGGAVLLVAFLLIFGNQNNALLNIAIWALFFAPPLLFGYTAYQRPDNIIPRILALTGIFGGVGGLLNIIVTLIGGGDWSKPNNPALGPLILGTYIIGILLTLVWLVGTIIVLLRRKV